MAFCECPVLWNECSKNADISILRRFWQFSVFFINIEKVCEIVPTFQVSNHLDYPNRIKEEDGQTNLQKAQPI